MGGLNMDIKKIIGDYEPDILNEDFEAEAKIIKLEWEIECTRKEVIKICEEALATTKEALEDEDEDEDEEDTTQKESCLEDSNILIDFKAPDPKAEVWAAKNPWYGKDIVMSRVAYSIHFDLIEDDFDPSSDTYYCELSKRIKKQFPNKF